MANDLTFGIRIKLDGGNDAVSDANKVSGAFNQFGSEAVRSGAAAQSGLAASGEGVRSLSGLLDGMAPKLAAAFSVWPIYEYSKAIVEAASSMQQMDARLKVATASAGDFARAQAEVLEISNRYGASMEETGRAFARLNPVITQIGGNAGTTLKMLDGLSASLKLSGATAAETSSVLLQFSQAMGSGRVGGDEFRSMMENAEPLMRAVAKQMGKTTAELRQMSEEGKLTSSTFGNALLPALDKLSKQAASIPLGIDQAWQALKNNLTSSFGKEFADSTGITSKAIQSLSGHTQEMAAAVHAAEDAMLALGKAGAAIAAGALVAGLSRNAQAFISSAVAAGAARAATLAAAEGDLVAARAAAVSAEASLADALAKRQAVAQIALYGQQRAAIEREVTAATAARTAADNTLAAAETRLAAAQTEMSVSARAAAVATGGARTALAGASGVITALGGPIGAVITLLTVGATAWTLFGNSAKDSADTAAEAVNKINSEAAKHGRDGQAARIAERDRLKKIQAEAYTEYGAAGSPSAKSAVWEKYGMGKLSDQIIAFDNEIKAAQERTANLGKTTSEHLSAAGEWNKLTESLKWREKIVKEYNEKLANINQAYADKWKETSPDKRPELERTQKLALAALKEDRDKQLRELTTHSDAISAARLERQKAEQEQSKKIADASAQAELADLEGRHRALLISDEDYYARRRAIRLDALNADQTALLKERKAQAADFARQTDPVKKEQSQTKLINIDTQLRLNVIQTDVAKKDNEAERTIRDNAISAARLEREKAEQEQSARIIDAYAKAELADLEGRHRALLISDEEYYARRRAIRLDALNAEKAALLEERRAQADDMARQSDPVKKEQSRTKLINTDAKLTINAIQTDVAKKDDEAERTIRDNAVTAARLARQKAADEASKSLSDGNAKRALADLESAHKAELVSDESYYDQKRAIRLKALNDDQADLLKQIKRQAYDYAHQTDPVKEEESLAKLIKLKAQYKDGESEIAHVEKDGYEWAVRQKATIAEMGGELNTATHTMQDYVAGLTNANAERALEIQAFALAEPQRATFLQQKREELALEKMLDDMRRKGISFSDADVAGYKRALADSQANEATLNALKRQDAAWQQFYGDIQRGLTDSLMRAGEQGGKSAGELVVSGVKNTLRTSAFKIAITAMVDPIMGGVRQLGSAVLGGGNGLLGTATNGYNLVNSVSGSGGYASQAGAWLDGVMGTSAAPSQGLMLMQQGAGFEGSQAALLASQTSEFGAAGAALTDAAAGAGAGMAEGFLAAIPGWGWAALGVGALLGSGVLDHQGGPKTSYSGGAATSAFGPVNAANMGYAPENTQITAAVNAGIASYQATVTRFGGTPTAISLRAAGDSDPMGKAPDSAGTSLMMGGNLYQNFKNFDKGQGQAAIPDLINRAMLTALQHTDFKTPMGKLLHQITDGLDASSITPEMLTKTNAAIAGATTIFGASSPLEVAMAAAKASAAGLATQFTTAGVSGDLSSVSIKQAVLALDRTSAAGQEAARSMLALVPAVQSYEGQLLGLIGFTKDSLSKDLFDAIQNNPDAASAGEKFASDVIGGIQNAMLGDLSSQISQIVTDGIIQPALNALITQSAVSDTFFQANIDAATKKAQATATAFAAIWGNADFQAALATIKTSVSNVTKTALGSLPNTPGVFFDSSKQSVKDAAAAAEKAQKDAEKNAEDLKNQMADVAAAIRTIGMDALTKSLLDAAKATDDAITKAKGLGAAESDLNQIRALGDKQTRQLINDAGLSAYQKLDSAQGGQLQARYNSANARGDYNASIGSLSQSIGITTGKLDEIIQKSGGLLPAAIQYWDGLTTAQQQAVIKAVNAQAVLTEETTRAQRALVDGQVDLIKRTYDAYKSVVSFRDGLDEKILSVRQADPSFDTAVYWSGKINEYGAAYQSLIHSDAANTPESLNKQLDLAQKIENAVMGRYEAELAALRRTTDATRELAQSSVDLRKYVESLRVGDLSPETAGVKLAAARSQYEKTLNTANGDYEKTLALANGGDINAQIALKSIMDARRDLSGKADTYLKQSQSYYGGASAEYRKVFSDAVSTIEGLAQPGQTTEQLLSSIHDADITYNQQALTLSRSADQELTAIKAEAERRLPEIADTLITLSNDLNTYLGSNSPLIAAITGSLPQQLANLIGRPALGDAPMTISGPAVSDDALRATVAFIGSKHNGDTPSALLELYQVFRANGVSSARAASALGIRQEDILQWARDNNLPAFAAGADRLPADMLAVVHEGERIIPAADNRQLLAMLKRPATDTALAQMIDRLNAQIAGLRQDARLIGDAQVKAVIESAEAIPARIAAGADRLHRADWARSQA